MRVIGLDLSLTNSGVAVLGEDATELYRIPSSSPKVESLQSRMERFDLILLKFPRIHPGDLVVIEQPAFSRTNGKHHDRSGLWWFAVDLAQQSQADLVEVPPSTLKKYVTGKGSCGKSEVMAAMIRRMADLHPGIVIHDDNEADALALAALGARLLGHPVDGNLPKVNLASFDAWTKMLRNQGVSLADL